MAKDIGRHTHTLAPHQTCGVVLFNVRLHLRPDGQVGAHPVHVTPVAVEGHEDVKIVSQIKQSLNPSAVVERHWRRHLRLLVVLQNPVGVEGGRVVHLLHVRPWFRTLAEGEKPRRGEMSLYIQNLMTDSLLRGSISTVLLQFIPMLSKD